MAWPCRLLLLLVCVTSSQTHPLLDAVCTKNKEKDASREQATGCQAPVEIRASRKGDLNKCSHEHLFPGCLFRYAETRVGRESWAWRHMPVSSGLMKLQQGLRPAFATNSEREAMGAYVKNQNLDGVTRLVDCLPSMKDKAKPEFDPQHHWRQWAHLCSQH